MKKHLFLVSVSLLAVLFISYWLRWPWIEFFELKTMDLMYSMRGKRELKDPHVVVVAIDEKSLAAFENGVVSPFTKKLEIDYWPWSREKFGTVVERLLKAGAKTILMDISFTTPNEEDRKGDLLFMSVLNKAASRNIGVVIGTYMINDKETYEMYGGRLREELERNTYYLKYAYMMKHYRVLETLQPLSVYKVRPPIRMFSMVAPSASYEVRAPDVDGKIRSVPLFVEEKWALETGKLSGYLPHMDVLGVAFFYGQPVRYPTITIDFDKMVVEIEGRGESHKIPFDFSGSFQLLYYGPGEDIFPTYSFVDVYTGNLDPGVFKDKVVIIGYTSTAKGLYDLRNTPVAKEEAGVYIHATAVENMIRGESLRRISGSWRLALIVISMTISWLFLLSKKLSVNVLTFLLIPALVVIGYEVFLKGVYMDIFYPVFSVSVLGIYGVGYNVYENMREKRRFREFLYRYLDESVAERIVRSGRKLENEKKKVVVLFSDIKGFTGMSENMDPEEVVRFLNTYFERMSRVIKRNGGMIDKFIGDAIMAVFGVPDEKEDDIQRALRSAIEMREELDRLRKELGIDVDNGIGLHYGEVVVGNIGASFRWDYTVIGDTVNTASRIESLTRKVEYPILVSDRIYESAVGIFEFEYIGEFQVKGKKEKVKVYGLVRERAPHSQGE